jgi:hypothetical protein
MKSPARIKFIVALGFIATSSGEMLFNTLKFNIHPTSAKDPITTIIHADISVILIEVDFIVPEKISLFLKKFNRNCYILST